MATLITNIIKPFMSTSKTSPQRVASPVSTGRFVPTYPCPLDQKQVSAFIKEQRLVYQKIADKYIQKHFSTNEQLNRVANHILTLNNAVGKKIDSATADKYISDYQDSLNQSIREQLINAIDSKIATRFFDNHDSMTSLRVTILINLNKYFQQKFQENIFPKLKIIMIN